MSEKNLIIDDLRLHYSGIFDMEELFRTINAALLELGYSKREKKSEETVKPEGRDIKIELRPSKRFEEDFYGTLKVRIRCCNVTDTIIRKNGRIYKMNKGDILIILDAWTTSYIEHAWETNPTFAFFRMLYDKYFKLTFFLRHQDDIAGDLYTLKSRIKAHLNLYKLYSEEEDRETLFQPKPEHSEMMKEL